MVPVIRGCVFMRARIFERVHRADPLQELLLRTRSGNLRKPVFRVFGRELKVVGFEFEHADQIGGSSSPTLMIKAICVR